MGPRSRAIHDYSYQIHVVDEAGDIVETIGEMNNFVVANAAFEAALTQRTWCLVELREGARIIESAKTGGYDSATKLVDLVWRKR